MRNSNKVSKPKILYIGKQKNKKLIEILTEQYDLTTCEYVLPKTLEDKLGTLKFEYPYHQYDPHWDFRLSSDVGIREICLDYGLDLKSSQLEKAPVAINLKYYLANFFFSLGFPINTNYSDSISTLLKQNTSQYNLVGKRIKKANKEDVINTYVKESDLIGFELIIIENQIENKDIAKGIVDPYTSNLENYFTPQYYLYNIAPSIIKNLIISGKKILILMEDMERIQKLDQKTFRRYNDFFKQTFELEFVTLDNNIEKLLNNSSSIRNDDMFINFPLFVNIADKLTKVDLDIRKFYLEINEKYIKNISPQFKFFWTKMDGGKLFVSNVISFKNIEKNYLGNNLLVGNKDTTGICMLYSNQTTYEDVKIIYDYVPLIGVMELTKKNKFCILPESLISTDCLINDNIINFKFFNETVKSLLDVNEFFRKSEFGLNPKIELKVREGQLLINGLKVKLGRMEFCYYRFFLERALNGEDQISFTDQITLNRNYKQHINDIPEFIIKKILSYYQDSFPNDYSFIRLRDQYDKGKTPDIKQTFIPHISKINKKIKDTLNLKVEERFLKKLIIQSKNQSFFISAEAPFIEIL